MLAKPKMAKVAKIIITLYKSTFRTLFYSRSIVEVYHSINNLPQLLVMPHGILLNLSYSPPSLSPTRWHNRPHAARIFKAQLYLWLCYYQSCRITDTSSLATEVSTEEILVFQFAHEIRHRPIFSMFDSIPCGLHGTILNKHCEKFCSILTCHLFRKW